MRHHHRILGCLLVLAAGVISAVAVASGATAAPATLQDLRDLGYTVGVANQRLGCTTWTIQGYGVQIYADNCSTDFQQTVESMVKGHCDRKWQYDHPEQVDVVQSIRRKGWGVTGDECADLIDVTNPATPFVHVYSGAMAGLAALNDTLVQAAGAPADPTDQSWWCLPLCATAVAPVRPVTVTIAGPTVVQTVTVASPAPPPEVRTEVRTVTEPAPPPVVQTVTVTETVTVRAPVVVPKKAPVKKAARRPVRSHR